MNKMNKIRKIFSILLIAIVLFSATYLLTIKTVASTSSYYSGMDTLYGSTLKTALRNKITSTHTYKTSYDDCKDPDIVKKTDGNASNTKIVLFWSGINVNTTWDSGTTWNREHVWPQSKGWFSTSGAGSDLHHIRPSDPSVNSSHGNNPYGVVSGSYYVTTSTANGSVTIGAKCKGGIFEPSDDKKGDTARILFYLLVRYAESDSYSITEVATSMDMLLEWNDLDPVDSSETIRNEAVYSIQGNRNPFIDNSDYADYIWGGEKPGDNSSSGSGSDSGSNDSGSSDSGSSSGGTSSTLPSENRVALFDFGASDSSKTDESSQDGSAVSTYTENNGDYTLTLSNLTKVYGGSYDAVGNSCLKVGTSSSVGSFSFIVSDDISQVAISVAGYKSKTASISINGGSNQSITTYSANGEYTNIIVDTSSNKTVTFTTTSSGYRCKIDAIAFYNENNNPGGDVQIPSYGEALSTFTNEYTKASMYFDYTSSSYTYSTSSTYSYEFPSKVYSDNGTQTLGELSWQLENDGGYYGYSSDRGHQFGSANKPASEVILRTSELMKNVTSVKIYASGASGTDANIAVYVGTKRMGTIKDLTDTNSLYTFSSTEGLNGRVKIRITQDSEKAVYIKKITFTHADTATYEYYNMNNASLRFGTCIDKDIYDTLNNEGAIWGVEYYKGTVTDWSTVSGTKIQCTPAQVSYMGATEVDSNGQYYQFALVLKNITYSNIDTYVSARAYVIIDGVTYYMNSTTYSVRSLASAYLNGIDSSSYSQHAGILEHIKYY